MYIGTIDEMVHENAIVVLKLDREAKLYTHPRQWQNLTEDEIASLRYSFASYTVYDNGNDMPEIELELEDFVNAIQQALKDKNT
jgi:hypothetical protein